MSLVFNANFGDLTAANRSLEETAKSIPKWLTADITVAIESLKEKASKQLEQQTVKGLKQTGLRASIASGIKVVPITGPAGEGAGLIVEVNEANMKYLPRGLDDILAPKGWKHPVFGNTKKWVTQYGPSSWFADSVETVPVELETTLQADLDKAAKLNQII